MRKIAVLMLITLLWAGAAYADGVISLNQESYGGIPNSATDTAGVINAAHWNDTWLDNQNNSPMTDLRDNTGAATTVDVSWTSTGRWSINNWGSPGQDLDGTWNSHLLKGYIDAHSPDTCTLTLSEIPYDYYDIYVYFSSDVAGRAGTVTDGTTTYYFTTYGPDSVVPNDQGGTANAIFAEATAQNSDDAVASNYAIFSSLQGASQTVVTDVQDGGGIAGFQVVETSPPNGPSNPVVTPDNGDGSVGDIVDLGGGLWDVQNVMLHFIAAKDPNELHQPPYRLNPDIVLHNIYLQTGAPSDPNLYLYDSVEANIVDPYTDDPNVSYGPLPNGLLKQGTVYEWQVEEVLDNGAGGYAAGDPNNVFGPVWSFTTGSATPTILSISYHTLTDINGNAALTIETGTIANNYRWFKVVGDQDVLEVEGDLPDAMLTDGGIYSTTTTKTLTITGAASDGSDDAQYYAIAYNGDPEGVGIASAPSDVRWVWYPREVHRYTFEPEDVYVADSNDFVADTIGTSDMQLKSDDGTLDVPSIDPNNPDAPGLVGSNSLFLNNPNTNADPNNADGEYAQINDPMVTAYADITIAAWIYHKGGGWQRILGFGNDNGSGTNGIDYMYLTPSGNNNSGQLMLNVNGQSVQAPTGSVPENEWAYVTATLSGDTAKLYVNGEWVATNEDLTNDPIANSPTPHNWIGRSQWYTYDSLFNGYIADLRFWNYGLTTDEVAQLYMADDTNAEYVCESEIDNLLYDYNNNCIVDLGDFAEIASKWLENHRITP